MNREHVPEARLGFLAVADAAGRPIPERRLSAAQRDHLDALGFTDLHVQGLRHTTALAERSASEAEIMAITLHRSSSMVARDARRRDQRLLAEGAMARLEAAERERNGKLVNIAGQTGKHSSRGPASD